MSSLPSPEDNDPTELVTLQDETGRSLACYVERYFEAQSQTYLLLLPVDTPVEIFAWNEDEDLAELVPVEEPTEIDKIFDDAYAVLSEQYLTLRRTAYCLTVSGDIPDPNPEDILTLEIEDEDREIGTEEFQILRHFFHEEQEYAICTPVDPLLFFGKQESNGSVTMITPEESELIQPMLADILIDEI